MSSGAARGPRQRPCPRLGARRALVKWSGLFAPRPTRDLAHRGVVDPRVSCRSIQAFVADCFYDPIPPRRNPRGGRCTKPCPGAHAHASTICHSRADQRVHPLRHPRHVSGALLIHMTGMMGFAHAYYVLGLRHAEGWVGYGVRIDKARFVSLAQTGVPLNLECRGTCDSFGIATHLGQVCVSLHAGRSIGLRERTDRPLDKD